MSRRRHHRRNTEEYQRELDEIFGLESGDELNKAQDDDVYNLVHFSSKKGLKEIDPSFQGSAMAGKEKGNIQRSRDILNQIGINVQPANYIHTYMADTGAPESMFERSPAKYRLKADKSKIYDLSKDPEGVFQAVKDKYPSAYYPGDHALAHPDLVHNEIKQKGYKGWTVSGHPQPRFRDTVMLYEKTPAEEIQKEPEAAWEGTSLDKSFDLLKSDIPKDFVVVYSDADNAGNMAKKAVFTNNLSQIKEISKKISLTSEILAEYIEKSGGQTVNSGGDDYTGIMPKDKIGILQEAASEIKRKSGFTVTIGIGDTPKKSVYALTYGKLTGKNKIVEWDEGIQEHVDSLRPKDVQDKQIESLS